MKQQQFLEVLDRDEAERRWRAVVGGDALGSESALLEEALGRILAEDVRSAVDVPGFDRSNMDGFAIQAADTFGASEEEPVRLRLNDEILATGIAPQIEVTAGTATVIATGGMFPRGADRGHRCRPGRCGFRVGSRAAGAGRGAVLRRDGYGAG